MTTFDPRDYCRAAVLDVEPYRPGTSTADLAREHRVEEMIKLSSNENVLGPSPYAIEAVRECASRLMLYPDGGGRELCRALAERHHVSPDCITLGNGSNEILELVGRCFLREGVNAVYAQHAFAVYELTVQICGADSRVAPAFPLDGAMPGGHDLDALADNVNEDTRVVFIANPNNPTGTWFNAAALDDFIRKIPPSTVMVIDEAYAEYVPHADYPSAADRLEEFPNLIVTRTFSKIFGLAGLRVGYALSSANMAELMNRVRQPFNVNVCAQHGALVALRDTEHLEKSISMNTAGLEQLQAGCEQLQLSWMPSAANFICVEVGDNAADICRRLIAYGVIVRPLDNYQLPRHLRVTVGRAEHNRRFLTALKEVLGR